MASMASLGVILRHINLGFAPQMAQLFSKLLNLAFLSKQLEPILMDIYQAACFDRLPL